MLLPLGFYILGTLFLIAISVFYSKMNLLISLSFLSLYGMYLFHDTATLASCFMMRRKNITKRNSNHCSSRQLNKKLKRNNLRNKWIKYLNFFWNKEKVKNNDQIKIHYNSLCSIFKKHGELCCILQCLLTRVSNGNPSKRFAV